MLLTQPSRWKNSNAVSVLMHHRDLIGIRTVRQANPVDFKPSFRSRQVIRMIYSVYWPGINRVLWWTKVEVRLSPGKRTFRISLLLVGRIDCQNLRQRGMSANQLALKDIPVPSTIPPSLRRLHGLDEASPEFQDELSNALHEEEYAQRVSNFQGDHLVWLVCYLDKVCCLVSCFRLPLMPP